MTFATSQPGSILSRIGKLLYLVVYIFAVLISFPNVQPIVFLVSFLTAVVFGRYLFIIIGFALTPLLVLIKLPYITVALIALIVFQLVTSVCLFKKLKSKTGPSMAWILSMWLWPVVWLWFAIDTHLAQHASKRIELDPSKSIVCLGDSLTDYGYPDELKQMTKIPVTDFGQDGIETADGLKQLPAMLKTDPQVVVIELGGHDYNKGKPREVAESNLRQLIEKFQSVGAVVILVEIPRGFIFDPYFGLERQLAREYNLELIPDTLIRRFIFWSPIIPPGNIFSKEFHLSSDGLHPNKRGNELFAQYVMVALDRVGK